MSKVDIISLHVLFEGQWWIGVFERITSDGYSVARQIFGTEPADIEVYEFILKHQDDLCFSTPLPEEESLVIKNRNPKRVLRKESRALIC